MLRTTTELTVTSMLPRLNPRNDDDEIVKAFKKLDLVVGKPQPSHNLFRHPRADLLVFVEMDAAGLRVARRRRREIADEADFFRNKTITLSIGTGPGGGYDQYGRLFARHLGRHMPGAPNVIVQNVPGAGGMTGVSRVASGPADGYQIAFGGVDTLAINQTLYKKPLYNAATDFAPVGLVTEQPMVLIARKDFPADDMKGFIAHTKANAAKMQYASSGVGSGSHLTCARLNAAMGVDVTHVTYRGSAQAMQDLIRVETEQQTHLVARHHVLNGRSAAIGRGEVHVERRFHFAHVGLGAAALAVERQDLLRRPVELAEVGDQEEGMQQQIIGAFLHHQHDATRCRPGARLILQIVAPLARLLGWATAGSLQMRSCQRL